MAISYIATASVKNASSGSSIISVPTGTSNGHVMVAFVVVNNTTTTTTPSGWTLIDTQVNGVGFTGRTSMYYRVANSEPANYTFTHSSTQRNAGWIATFSGVDTSTVTDGSSKATGNACQAPSITTTTSNTMLIYGVNNDNTFACTFTPPTGMTEFIDTGGAGGVYGAYQAIASTGATGTRTATPSSSGNSAQQMVALREATAPPSNTTNFFRLFQ